jgi:hypothetical protein
VRALNSIFQQWKISAQSDQWNISGEPCTGAAIDDNIGFENVNYNPFVKCTCSYKNDTICHINELLVFAQHKILMFTLGLFFIMLKIAIINRSLFSRFHVNCE